MKTFNDSSWQTSILFKLKPEQGVQWPPTLMTHCYTSEELIYMGFAEIVFPRLYLLNPNDMSTTKKKGEA